MSTLYILVVGAVLLAIAQLLLLGIKRRESQHIFLALFVTAMLVPIWGMASWHLSQAGLLHFNLDGVFQRAPWLYGPLLWWHIVSRNQPNTRNWLWLVHLIPFGVQVVLYYANLPALSVLTKGSVHFVFVVSHISLYVAFCIVHLWQQRSRFFEQKSNPLPVSFMWYVVLIGGLAMVMVWDFVLSGVSVFGGRVSLAQWNALFIAESAYLVVLSFVAPTLDWRLNLEPQTRPERTTRLSDSAATSLAGEMKHQMETHQWYTQPDFSLTDLAKLIGMSTHDVSEILNQHLSQTFYEFVNTYRVELACQQLKSDASLSATEVGFACGFNSKSAYYNAFKKFKQTTPAQFRLS